MSEPRTLSQVLRVSEAKDLEAHLVGKGHSPVLGRLDDPKRAMRFITTNLCGSYVFARYVVPAFAAAVFASLPKFQQPVDDELGKMLSKLMELVQGELFNNNIFERPGECHAHFHDALEAFAAAGGDMQLVKTFFELEAEHGFDTAVGLSPALWSAGSVRFALGMIHCCDHPLDLFIFMPANETVTSRIYASALASMNTEPRFAKFNHFIARHVQLDQDDHSPVALQWLEMYVQRAKPSPEDISLATGRVLKVLGG